MLKCCSNPHFCREDASQTIAETMEYVVKFKILLKRIIICNSGKDPVIISHKCYNHESLLQYHWAFLCLGVINEQLLITSVTSSH